MLAVPAHHNLCPTWECLSRRVSAAVWLPLVLQALWPSLGRRVWNERLTIYRSVTDFGVPTVAKTRTC